MCEQKNKTADGIVRIPGISRATVYGYPETIRDKQTTCQKLYKLCPEDRFSDFTGIFFDVG